MGNGHFILILDGGGQEAAIYSSRPTVICKTCSSITEHTHNGIKKLAGYIYINI